MVAPVRTYIQPKVLSDVVAYEEELAYSREIAGTVKNTTVAELGTPLALDANSKMVALPADGSLACIGVSLSYRDATAADTTGDIQYIARQALLKSGGISWPAGISDTNKTKAITELKALPGPVVVRTSL